MLDTYRRVLSRPGAALFSASAALARLPLSMVGLGLVLLVESRTGSYTQAGTVAAAHVLAAAVFAPIQGRLTDRVGQAVVLWTAAGAYAAATALTLVAITSDWGVPWPHVCAALAGLATPQTGNMVRARWTHTVSDRSQLNTAFSIEAVLDEVVFVVGPVLVTFLALHASELSGLIVAAIAAVTGSCTLALQRGTQPPVALHEVGDRPPIRPWLLVPVVVASVGLGVLFGSTEVIVVAFSTEEGQRGAAGVVLATWAAGSLVAGLVVGALPQAPDPLRRLRTSLALLSLAFVPLLVVDGVVALAAFMLLGGLMISPSLIATVQLVEVSVPAARLTEGLAWTTTGLAVGVAPGAALAGWVVDHHGASAAFLVPLAAGLLGMLTAFAASVKH